MKSKTIHHLTIVIIGFFVSYSMIIKPAEKKIEKKEIAPALVALSEQHYFFNPEKEKYVCATCSRECTKRSHILSHLHVHATCQYECTLTLANGLQCGLKTKRLDGHKRHIKEVHENIKRHECDQCLKRFKRIEHLQEHTNRKHPIKRKKIIVKKSEQEEEEEEEEEEDEEEQEETVLKSILAISPKRKDASKLSLKDVEMLFGQ